MEKKCAKPLYNQLFMDIHDVYKPSYKLVQISLSKYGSYSKDTCILLVGGFNSSEKY